MLHILKVSKHNPFSDCVLLLDVQRGPSNIESLLCPNFIKNYVDKSYFKTEVDQKNDSVVVYFMK